MTVFPFVVTSIDVEPNPSENANDIVATYGAGAEAIKFSGKIEADFEDEDAAVLLDVEQKIEGKDDKGKDINMFYGVKVPKETFHAKLKATGKSFFAYVHGFQTEPEVSFATCKTIQDTKDFPRIVIPVIWPSVGSLKNHEYITTRKYNTEQKISKAAGGAFSTISEVGVDMNIAIMCHSMGNRTMFSFASTQSPDPGKRFDRIFMVAADVWEEVFNERVIEKKRWPPQIAMNEWQDTGLKVVRMLKPDGMVHIVHYKGDLALTGSWAENRRTRLGKHGIAAQNERDRVHDETKPYLVDFDMDADDERREAAKAAGSNHSYQAAPVVIKYYMECLQQR